MTRGSTRAKGNVVDLALERRRRRTELEKETERSRRDARAKLRALIKQTGLVETLLVVAGEALRASNARTATSFDEELASLLDAIAKASFAHDFSTFVVERAPRSRMIHASASGPAWGATLRLRPRAERMRMLLDIARGLDGDAHRENERVDFGRGQIDLRSWRLANAIFVLFPNLPEAAHRELAKRIYQATFSVDDPVAVVRRALLVAGATEKELNAWLSSLEKRKRRTKSENPDSAG